MTRSLLLTLLCALLFAAAGISSAQTPTFHASGEFAETFISVNGGTANVFAARGCTSNPCFTTQTILVFHAFALTPNGSVFIEGDGVIPDSAFDASSPEHATLNIDTSQISGFNTIACSFVPGTGFTCQPGPTGVIQVEWQRTRTVASTRLEEDLVTQGPFVIHTHINQDFFSASASGSFFGTSFSNGSRSQIGTNKDTNINLSRQN